MVMKTDSELLAAYAEEDNEAAFAELVARHTDMVYRACFRMLGDIPDAEDAAQATFIVLARKWRTIRINGDLSSWLYGVARRTALLALRNRGKRNNLEKEVREMDQVEDRHISSPQDDEAVLEHIDRELAALSQIQRQAVILRYLKGFGEKEAAEVAGCPVGTLSRRASEGLANLRTRLAKCGFAVGMTSLAGILEAEARMGAPETLLHSILAACKVPAAGAAGAAAASGNAALLAKGVLKMMFWGKIGAMAATVAAVAIAGTGVTVGVEMAANAKSSQGSHAEKGRNMKQQDNPILQYILQMLYQAQQDRATELILEPVKDGKMPIRYKVDGTWREFAPPPSGIRSDAVAELGRLAGVSEVAFPKEGIIDTVFSGVRLRWKMSMKSAEAECVLTPVAEGGSAPSSRI